jgi:hypothetical protein
MLGFEQVLGQMRRLSMNVLVHAPEVGEGGGFERLDRELALCRRYGVCAIPPAGEDVGRLSKLGAAFRESSTVLGWYIRDEPEPGFLPKFLAAKAALEAAAPEQPAVCLFYRPDSAMAFAPHQPVLLTDCYPFAYAHDGTSLGPPFALRDGPLALGDGLGQFNPWGRRGVLEWMDLCRSVCGDIPHWITLQTFESGDGRTVRWREPTVPEMRLQTWLAVPGAPRGSRTSTTCTAPTSSAIPGRPVTARQRRCWTRSADWARN